MSRYTRDDRPLLQGVLGVVLVIAHVLRSTVASRNRAEKRWFYKFRSVRGFIIYMSMTYFTLTLQSLKITYCRKVGDVSYTIDETLTARCQTTDSKLRVNTDPSVLCYEGAHLPAALVAWPIIILITLASPVALYYHIIRSGEERRQLPGKRHCGPTPVPHLQSRWPYCQISKPNLASCMKRGTTFSTRATASSFF